jgi:predicted nucleotide-binding protein
MRPWKILFVDDHALYRTGVALRLEQEGYEVVVADNENDARRLLRSAEVDLAVLDLRLNEDDPHDVRGLELAIEEVPEIPKIVVTMHEEVQIRQILEVLERRGVRQSRLPRIVFKYGEKEGLAKLLQVMKEELVPRVFIVHGHNREVRDRVRERVEQLGLRPCILAMEPMGGETLIEQLEKEARRAHFALVLLTGDDRGAAAAEVGTLRPRARQNVVFELGYFAAALGRKRVLALCEPGVEIPSNYLGVRYVELDPHGDWRTSIERELRNAGIELDLYRRP